MTLLLETESHGIVEAGFYAAFMQFARLGEYTFATRHFCETIQYLAENNELTETTLLGYNLDTFSAGSSKYHQKIFKLLLEQAGKSITPALTSKKKNLKEQLEQWQNEFHIDGNNDASSKGKIIPVTVTKDEQAIQIGKYEVSSLHFGRMSYYLAHGGFFGWSGKGPRFAAATMEALNNSERRLYQEIRKELKQAKKHAN